MIIKIQKKSKKSKNPKKKTNYSLRTEFLSKDDNVHHCTETLNDVIGDQRVDRVGQMSFRLALADVGNRSLARRHLLFVA